MAKESGIEISPDKLEDFSSDQKYDLILLTSYVFQLFPDPIQVFKLVQNLLASEGKVYFSVFIPWSEIVGEIPEGEWLVDDEIRLPNRNKARCWVNFDLDRVRQRLTRNHRYEILEKKKVVEKTESIQEIRYYTLPELELLVEKADFQHVETSYEFSETYDSDAHSMGLLIQERVN